MKTIASCLAVVSALATTTAQGGWKNLTGKPVPKITATKWLNTSGQKVDRDNLKGKVWLLEFFATT